MLSILNFVYLGGNCTCRVVEIVVMTEESNGSFGIKEMRSSVLKTVLSAGRERGGAGQ